MSSLPAPAALLEGLTLTGGWKVGGKIGRSATATGGCFSESYAVFRDGEHAFLKALDYSLALQQPDQVAALQVLTAAYLHERSLLEKCAAERLSHVVVALDFGEVEVPGQGLLARVPYLILERADGDVRAHIDALDALDLAWCLRSLHHASVGLQQLHRRNIFHQDTKPSNVLVFPDGARKIGDLGRASRQGYAAVHDRLIVPGDPIYAPPELLYGYILPDESRRRMACDMYLLGSLLVYFFTRVGMTAGWGAGLHQSLYPANWRGSFYDVLPHVRDAYDKALQRLSERIPETFRDRLIATLRELCDPDPNLRGDGRARARHQNPYSLERYVSRLDRLAREAELQLKRSVGL
jgi:serine/threonine protein kinase